MLLMELFGRQNNFIRKVQGVTAACEHIKSRFSLLACFHSSFLSMCHLSLAMDIMVNIFFLCAVWQTEDERHKWQGWCVCGRPCVCIDWGSDCNLSAWCNRMVIEMLFWYMKTFSKCTVLCLQSHSVSLSCTHMRKLLGTGPILLPRDLASHSTQGLCERVRCQGIATSLVPLANQIPPMDVG